LLAAAALLAGPALGGCVRALPVDPARLGGLALTSTVLAADGSMLTSLHAEQDRRPVRLGELPPVLVDAVLAAEDRRFYDHSGVDARGIARAAGVNARSGELEQGGSTITQQLVKNTLVTPERTLGRKVREASLALGLERSLSKDSILERYLNTVYFGSGAYGVGAAARTYLGREVSTVTLADAALLAGLLRSPAGTDPVRHPEAARARRAAVLAVMVADGSAESRAARRAAAAPLPTPVARGSARYPAAHAVQDAVSSLLDDPRLGATRSARQRLLFSGGVTVRLTLDPQQQQAAEDAVAAVLDGPNEPDAAVAAVAPGDGAIRVMTSSRDFFATADPLAKVNLARGGTTKRQAGSTYKMFTLLAALEHGLTPDTELNGSARVTIPRRTGPVWEVDNYEQRAYGAVTLREATEESVNTAYARLVTRLGEGDADRGAKVVAEVASRLGVRGAAGSPVRRDPSSTLGAQEVDPVGLAAAYATLAAGGVYAAPYLVASVTASDGRVLLRNGPQRRRVVAAGVAAVANDVLQGVIRRGTGVRARLPRPVAGKTGTATAYRDAWFAGHTPNLATAVWLGVARAPVPMTPAGGFKTVVAGGTLPAEIWRRTMAGSLLGRPAPDFPGAAGAAVSVRIDEVRGCRANQWTPAAAVVVRTYLRGTEPARVCTVPTGPPATVVPPVLGLRAEDAKAALDRVGFVPSILTQYDATYPAGTVVGQQPPSGTAVTAGAAVTVRVAARTGVQVVVPDLLGLPADAAAAALAGAGLLGEVVVAPSCTSGPTCAAGRARDAGRVWRQDLPAGTSTGSGTRVRYAVGPSA